MTLGTSTPPSLIPSGSRIRISRNPPVWLWGLHYDHPGLLELSSDGGCVGHLQPQADLLAARGLGGAGQLEEPAAQEEHHTPGGAAPPLGVGRYASEGLRIKPELPLEVGGPQQDPARKHFYSALLLRVLGVRTSR
jgi:hypothetical protein